MQVGSFDVLPLPLLALFGRLLYYHRIGPVCSVLSIVETKNGEYLL